VTVAVEGSRKPDISAISVDLPAPFGPSSPVTPGPIVIETSLTATTLRYHRDTWSIRISLIRPPRGDVRRSRLHPAVAAHQGAQGPEHGEHGDDQVEGPHRVAGG